MVDPMQVAITGATGYVGRYLVELHRRRGDRIRILKRPATPKVSAWHDIEVIDGDLSLDTKLLVDFSSDVDVLYHCAAEIWDERTMAVTNVEGTRALVNAATGRIKHWVQLSSAAVYGHVRHGVVSEDSAYVPDTIYGKTKLESDLIVRSAATSGAFTCSVLRPTAIFDALMQEGPLLQVVSLIDRGLFFFIGPTGATMNFVHVDNVVRALLLCATHPAAVGRDYIISDQLTVEQLAAIVAEETGRGEPRLRLPLAPIQLLARIASMLPFSPLTAARVNALSSRSIYSVQRIMQELDYKPIRTFESGLRDLVRAWKTDSTYVS